MHFFKYSSSKFPFLWDILISQLENRPTSQQGTTSSLLTWVIKFFFEEWGMVTILRNNSWSLNFHPPPPMGVADTGNSLVLQILWKRQEHLQSGWWWWLAQWKQQFLFYIACCLSQLFPSCLFPLCPPSPQTPRSHAWNEVQKEKKWLLSMLWDDQVEKKMLFLYFPPKFIF